MRRIPKILMAVLLTTVLLVTSVVPALAVATGKITTVNTTHYFQSYANDRWSDLKTPKHVLNSDKTLTFYCLQHKKATPKGQVYDLEDVMDGYNEKTRNGIYAIMFNGYPFNSYGLSAEKAFYATANALRCWLAERGDSQHYNMSKLNDFTAAQLRELAATGTITKKLKVKETENIAMLQFMVELLIAARNQETMTHNIALKTSDIELVNNGYYFSGVSYVSIENLRGGYKIDASGLPEGSYITGYTGKADDTLSISIPITPETAGQTYVLFFTGYDDRVPGNVRAFDAQDATYQRVLGVYAGANYMEEVCATTLLITTPSNPMPDLTIASLTTDRAEYNGGEKVTVTATVHNQGGADAEAFKTAVELEGLSPIQKECSGLASGASIEMTYEFTAPVREHADTLDVFGFADCENAVLESNESNNDAVASVNILAAQPDITITSLKADKSSYAGGETITLKAVVRNRGNRSADAFDVSLTATGMEKQIKALSGLEAGGSKTLTYTCTAPSGSSGSSIDFLAYADCDDVVNESNENNNKAETRVSVNAVLPDLTIESVTPESGSVRQGESVSISVVVGNRGNKDVADSDVKLVIGGRVVGTKPVESLPAGGNRTIAFSYTAPDDAPAGVLDIVATVDPDNRIRESNETNNTGTNTMEMEARLPDLTIVSVMPDPSVLQPGDTAKITVVVGNDGDRDVASSEVTLTIGGKAVASLPLKNLPIDRTTTLIFEYTIPDNMPEGTLNIVATVDPENSIAEKDETNNTGTGSMKVEIKLPDLTIAAVRPQIMRAQPGDKVGIEVIVGNQGEKAVASTEVTLFVGSEASGTLPVKNVSAGGKTALSFAYTVPENAPEGTLEIIAIVDPANSIRESNENNNTGRNTMQVEIKLPDLTIHAVTPNSSVVEPGETVTIDVVLGNDGDKGVSATEVSLMVDGEVIGSKPIGNLLAGGSTTISYAYTVPEEKPTGTLQVIATIDPGNLIRESNEDNNTGSSAIGVETLLPDLEIIATNASDWYSLMDVVVTATVRNNTPKAVPSVPVRLTVGNESYEERICVPGGAENLAVFRIAVPDVTGRMNISFLVDPDNEIEEMSESNNDLSHSVEIAPLPNGTVVDPDDPDLQAICESSGFSGMPELEQSTYHKWREYRYENGSYVLHDYQAKLEMSVILEPDERVAYEEFPDLIESGFGVSIAVKTVLSTNYDHAEKLVGTQRVWCWSPESGYGELSGYSDVFDSLNVKEGNRGDKLIRWEYAVNPHSETGSRLHYTPLWFPDGSYRIQAQGFQAWSPAGEMYVIGSDDVTIDGDMYDRVTAVN